MRVPPYGPIRLLELSGEPEDIGRGHGEAYADEIRAYADDRIERSLVGAELDRETVLALAAETLDAHRDYAPDLYREMVAMAEAAGLTPAEAVVVGGFTDFVDLVRARAGGSATEDTCTAVMVPDAMADGHGYLAQTWDMHASATPHIIVLRLQPAGRPSAVVFTTVGCLGQIGLNEAGIAVGINNLTAADGRVGVTWPFVVRKVLQQTDVDAAVRCVMEADLAGGHNFLILDRRGVGYSIEAMPTARHVFELGDEALIHTNHCLAPETQAVEAERPAALQESSLERLEHASHLAAPVTVAKLMALTRDERAICRRPEPPFDYETCGAVIMRPATGELWACWGLPSESEFERFVMEVGGLV
ncbi:MAG: peptidase C45 [Acidimicrobiia bacterium]|nr:MAG: peptidase C45 [Acidimicrobiia bacterium]